MPFIKCVDLANDVIDETTERFKPEYRESDGLREEFCDICDIIDDLIEDVLAECFEVDVDDETKDIIIVVESINLVTYEIDHYFYEAVERCKAFSFSRNKVGDLVTTFRFPGVWRKAANHE